MDGMGRKDAMGGVFVVPCLGGSEGVFEFECIMFL